MNGLLEGNGRTTQSWVPAVDVWETDNELVYAFDIPGIPQEKISVELDEGALTVTGERERQQEVSNDRFYRFERRHGTFSRTVAVPQGVDETTVKADYRDGVLQVRVAKPEEAKPRKIEIGGGSSEHKTIEGTATQTA